jgi:hypothetical protein
VIGIYQFWQLTLDDSVRNATREVQIGKVTNGIDFVTAICSEFGAATTNCGPGSIQYSVQAAGSFAAITPATIGPNGILSNSSTFSGVSSSTATTPIFLLVQVAYLAPFQIPLIPTGVATEDGTRAFLSAVATVMENFG